jgi:hypothetical protein
MASINSTATASLGARPPTVTTPEATVTLKAWASRPDAGQDLLGNLATDLLVGAVEHAEQVKSG